MKSVKVCLLGVCLLAVGMLGNAHAADQGAEPMGKMRTILESNYFDKDWGYSLGLKAWVNEWSLPVENHIDNKTRFINQFESDPELTFVPAGMVRYRNFFIGGSFLPEKNYNFTQQTIGTGRADDIAWSIKPSGSRKEWDLNIGYFVSPNLAISIGYKKMERNLTNTYSSGAWTGIEDYPLSAHGPIIGLSAALPISSHLNFYGNLAYGWLSGDASQTSVSGLGPYEYEFDLDGNYYFGELGLNYVIPLQKCFSAVAITAGFVLSVTTSF